MHCLICEANDSQPVWQQGKLRIEKCRGCGVFFADGGPPEAELLELYNGDVLIGERPDPFAKEEGPQPAWKIREHNLILDGIERWGCSGGSLLDVGCFSGMFLGNAKKRGFSVAGVEPNRDAFLHVRDAQGYEVVHGNLESAHFPAERFSAVSFLDVIEHIPDPVTELREVFRILRPGGVLILTTPNVKGLPQRVVKTKRWLARQPWCPIDDVPWHLWGFTQRSLARCVQKAGFTIIETAWLVPSPLTTNLRAGSSTAKRLGLRCVAEVSKYLGMSDRMALFAQKR